MPLHLIKLCVGAESIADLEEWIAERMAEKKRLRQPQEQLHTTRMVPKRLDLAAPGGSLYWVIKGQVSARQKLIAVRPFTDDQGIGRCHLVMEPVVTAVEPRPMRPFQGWRYLEDKDAPRDINARTAGQLAEMPEALRRELVGLGLL
ncbi:DUF1489 family protein [Terrarubrum flagellatum]|uniref:DUF1489 family protein n=1 Tax=Terrirubrum flagellatum TaxID=2895980 RepID=UPI00314565C6